MERISYGSAFGILLCACCFVVDGLLTAVLGHRVPMSVPALLAAGYLIAGGLAGGLFAALAGPRANRTNDEEAAGAVRAQIRGALLLCVLAGVAAMFVQRVRLGFAGYASEELGYVPLAAGLVVGVIAVVTGWGQRFGGADGRTTIWPAVWATLFCGLWGPFGHLYQAPMLSRKSVNANAAFLVAGLLIYLLGRPVAGRIARAARLHDARKCLKTAMPVVLAGWIAASGVLWWRFPQPIDRPFQPPTDQPSANRSPKKDNDRPNIVLIVLDTVRADHLSVYGYDLDTTPNLSVFAREAVRYDQAVAASTWTLPSHAAMFTGLLPDAHGAHNVLTDDGWTIRPLDDTYVTLAEVLSQAGYHTGGVVGNSACLSREFGVHQGFDYYDDKPKPSLAAARPRTLLPAQWLSNHCRRRVDAWWKNWARNAEEVNADVLAWLDRGIGQPFFLFVNYLDAHPPYNRHAAFEAKTRRPHHRGNRSHVDSANAENAWRYDQEIAYTDEQVGALLAELKARGLYDHSLIVVTADHGEAFGEHGRVGHGNSLYHEEAHVPLLVRYPGGDVRGVRPQPTSLTAIPTIILDPLGLKFPTPPNPATASASWSILGELHIAERVSQDDDHGIVLRALFGPDGLKAVVESTTQSELYNLNTDPLEQTDIALQRPRALLNAVNTVDTRTAHLASHRPAQGESFTLSEALRERLRSLGYMK